MHEQYRQAAAQLLGMKRSEIVDVVSLPAGGGTVVTTHDAQRTLVTTEGVMGPWTGELPAAAPAEPDQAAEPGDDQAQDTADPGEPDPEPVPDGTTAEVLAWVGEDPERARRALDAETARDKPRTGLVAQLEKVTQG